MIQLPPGDFATSYESYLTNQGGMTRSQAIEAADKLAEFVMHGVGSDAEKRLSDFKGLLQKMDDAVEAQCAVSAAAGHADEYERA